MVGVQTLLRWLKNCKTAEDVWRVWLTSPVVRAFETGSIGPSSFADQLIADLSLPVTRETFLQEFVQWPKSVLPGAIELIRSIPSRYVRAVLCNTNVLHWPRMTEEMGLGELFECHFASHLIGKLKPD